MPTESEHSLQVVILTAIPAEYYAVRQHLQDVREIVHEHGTVYEQGLFLAKGKTWEVGIAQIGIGNVRSATEAERAITYFNPRFAFFVGIAGGLKDVRLGDVVVAKKVYAYEAGKEEIHFRPRPEIGQPAYALLQRAQIEAGRTAWLQRLGDAIPQPTPHVLSAPIAAGERIQASTRSATYKLIKMNYSDAAAIEMEGYGFLLALHSHPQVGGLVIRGISDLIDDKSEADTAHFQEKAANHASAFAFEVLAGLMGQPDSEASRSALPKNRRELSPPSLLSGDGDLFHLQQHGSNTGIVQQGNYNHNVQNFITHAPQKDDVSEGKAHLLRGQTALQHGDYIGAKQQLTKATNLIPEDNTPEEAAQVRYLLALTELAGKSPFSLALPTMRRVEQLIDRAIALHATYTYLFTAALFKRDFARNRWHEAQYLHEAQILMEQAQKTPQMYEDSENLAILAQCQPHLIRDSHSA